MGDVLEFLVDGSSGLAPGGVEGTAMIAGVCSKGKPGKAYLLGKRSDLDDLLGSGPLVDRLRDLFATGGQEPVVIAVPVQGMEGGYIRIGSHSGSGPEAALAGTPAKNMDAIVKITTSGNPGTAKYKLSTDGGKNYGAEALVPSEGAVSILDSGASVVFPDKELKADDIYEVIVRTAIGPIKKIGSGPEVTINGTIKSACELVIKITGKGGRNQGRFQLSMDGGDSFDIVKTIPADGIVHVGSTGGVITFEDSVYEVGTVYTSKFLPPVPSISAVLTALEKPLEKYDAEFVYITGPSDSTDWAAAGVKADSLWNIHRPTYFKMEYRLPRDDESIDDWTMAFKADLDSFSHRFVQVCGAFGEVSDTKGKRLVRNWGALQAGRTMSIPVSRAAGRVKDGGISQGTLHEEFTEGHQKILEKAGAITAKYYAGLKSPYWGDSKTLAPKVSDYQYEEVLRTVFKAVRLCRIAALKSMYDGAGDPVLGANSGGLAYLKASIESALATMVSARPSELADFKVEIPPGQDIVNNGVAVEFTLMGIPIIREIRLFASYVYAGSRQDPRLETV